MLLLLQVMWQKQVLKAFSGALESVDWSNKIHEAGIANQWFTEESIAHCLNNWKQALSNEAIDRFCENYTWPAGQSEKTAGLILAGNIPLVGMHDVLCTLISGFKARIKTSSDDKVLVEFWINSAIEAMPELANRISFSESFKEIDTAIATGSNNSSRYFEYYFRHIPHILRKNRNSVALISGNETPEELKALGDDIFIYYGLGCRNVTHLLLPRNYDLKPLIDALEPYQHLIHHFKYSNNYQYHKALLLMNLDPHLDNGFVIIKETPQLYSPVGMLGYSFYDNPEQAKQFLNENKEQIQCIVGNEPGHTRFGATQTTTLSDFADHVDTVDFLIGQLNQPNS